MPNPPLTLRNVPASLATLLLCACAGFQPQVDASALRVLDTGEAAGCRQLGVVSRRSTRHNSAAFNAEQAMRDAQLAVAEAGGDAYRVLDESGEGRDARVILQAYRCGVTAGTTAGG